MADRLSVRIFIHHGQSKILSLWLRISEHAIQFPCSINFGSADTDSGTECVYPASDGELPGTLAV